MTLNTQTAGFYGFAGDGSSSSVNSLGMREMQAQAFEKRDAQYLLIKAPPACGKSRALMFIALDKLQNQGIEKVIVAVPQIAIGSSFKDTELKQFGTNWTVSPYYDLCNIDNQSDDSKAERVKTFFNDPDHNILVCAHPTLIKFYKALSDKSLLNKTLVAIDEFHHVSTEESNQLGGVVDSLMKDSTAHIVAMTGSYFRGDRISVLSAEDESKFEQVVYTYYQQLNGYEYLKHLKLDYAFHDGSWLEGVDMLMNPAHEHKDYSDVSPQDYLNPESHCFDSDCGKPNIDLKTIIYIPNVNSVSAYDSEDKYNAFYRICEILGHDPKRSFNIDRQTGFYQITTRTGRHIKVANLIDEKCQEQTMKSLRNVKSRDDVDIIVALCMAKEGFDWPWCEHVLVVGVRRSLTEVVQIIGRATRDCEGKPIAKFTNLVKLPDAMQGDVQSAVDDMIKAISLSLMMEQVLLPNIKLVPRSEAAASTSDDKHSTDKVIIIDDDQLTPKVKSFIQDPNAIIDLDTNIINDLVQFKSFVLNPEETKGLASPVLDVELAKYLRQKLPISDWSYDDVKCLAKITRANLGLKVSTTPESKLEPRGAGGNQAHKHGADHDNVNLTGAGSALLDMRRNFINVSELEFSLIEHSNPFGDAYEFVSRILDAETLKEVQKQAKLHQIKMTEEEALMLWPIVKEFMANHHCQPRIDSRDPFESRLAAVIDFVAQKSPKH